MLTLFTKKTEETTETPLVSIALPAYNHGAFIRQALESILMQQTRFPYEIIAGDDGSQDDTYSVLEEYRQNHPDKLILLSRQGNRGVCQNACDIYKACRGKYIAILEGDDYWTYEYKLQNQVDFLESHPEYAGCFHDAEIISTLSSDGNSGTTTGLQYGNFKTYSQFNKYNPDIFPYDLLDRIIIPTASLVFRNRDFAEFFHTFHNTSLSLQWALHLYIIKNSKFRYFNEVWSVYRDHPGGITKKREVFDFNYSNIAILKKLRNDNYYKTIKLNVKKSLLREYREILYNEHFYKENSPGFRSLYLKFLWLSLNTTLLESRYFIGKRIKRKKQP